MDKWAREAGREENKHTAELQHGNRWEGTGGGGGSGASGWHSEIMEMCFSFIYISSPPFLSVYLCIMISSPFTRSLFSASKLNGRAPLCFVKCLRYESLYTSTYDSCLYIYIKFNSGNIHPPPFSLYYSQSNSIQIPLEHISLYDPCTIGFGGISVILRHFTCPAWIDVE